MRTLLIITILLGCAAVKTAAQRFSFAETGDGITLLDSGKKIYHYQLKTKSMNGLFPRAHYIHPLYGFNEEVLTEDFPEDHPHQRGIFWTWHQIYVGKYRVGDGWDCRNISWEVTQALVSSEPDVAVLNTVCYWNSDSLAAVKSAPQRFLKEDCSIRYQAVNDSTKAFEFRFTFTALKDTVKLGGSEDEKHYSGFSARFTLPQDVKFYADTLELTPELYGNNAGKEIRMTGSFGSGKNLSYALSSGTAPAGGLQKWILRKEKSMQNIAWPGNSSYIIIAPGKPVTATYKIIIIQNKRNK